MHRPFALILAALTLTSCTSLSSGWQALNRGDYSKAKEIAAYHLAQDPMNSEVYRLSASTYLAEDHADEAIRSAKFAVTLDETNEQASVILQKAYAAKKDWNGLCTEIDRASRLDIIRTSHEGLESQWREAATSLLTAGQSDGWPCYQALKNANADVSTLPDIAASRRAYSESLVRRGRYADAISLLESSSDPYDNQLMAARVYYQHLDRDPAREKLRQYMDNPTVKDPEQRIADAAEIAQNGRDYEMADEILRATSSPSQALNHAIVKLHLGQKEEARAYVKTWFAIPRETKLYLSAISSLALLGFSDIAWEGCENATFSSEDAWFSVSDTFISFGASSYARLAIETFAEKHRDDISSCMQAAQWFSNHQYTGEAIRWSERAVQLGATDSTFTLNLLDLYGQTRDFRSLQRSASAYLVSQTTRHVEANCEVAQIYAKYNDTARTYELLTNASKVGKLNDACETLYLKTLQKTGNYDILYARLEQQAEAGNLSRLKMAKWFSDKAETEKAFKASLAPYRRTDAEPGLRRDAEYEMATYAYDILENESEAQDALRQMLEAGNHYPAVYEMAANFWVSRKHFDKALDYANQWQNQHPSDPKATLYIGELNLRSQHYAEAEKTFDAYVEQVSQCHSMPSASCDPTSAIKSVMRTYQSAQADEEAYNWFLKTYSHYQNEDSPDLSLLALYANTTLNESARQHRISITTAQELKKQAFSAYETLIDRDKDTLRLANYGQTLMVQDQYNLARRAYDKIENSDRYDAGLRQSHLKACLKSDCSDDKLKKILSGLHTSKNWKSSLSLLRDANRTDLALSYFESEIESPQLDTRTSALNELITLYLELGQSSRISEIFSRFEAVAPAQPQTHTALLQATLRIGNWDEAARHFAFIVQHRPDTRETYQYGVKLSRIVPDHAEIQRLFQTLIQFAEGTPHRLEWLAEAYEDCGLSDQALNYYLKSEHASTVTQEALQFRILLMSIAAGDKTTENKYRARIEDSVLWNHERIYQLALAYEKADKLQTSHYLLEKAIKLVPENTKYRSYYLEQALRSRNTGLIMNALSEAIQQPTAEVMQPLTQNGAWLDAIDAIDQFAAIGQYEMATASMIMLQSPYILMFGRDAYIRKLKEVASHAVTYEADANETLSSLALDSDNPSDAFSHLSNVRHGEVWANAILQNPSAYATLLTQIETHRSTMSPNMRKGFDSEVYRTLRAHETEDTRLSDTYAELSGIHRSDSEAIMDALLSTQYADAARQIAFTDLSPTDIVRVLAVLSSRGFHKEAQSLAQSKYEHADKALLPYLALIRLMYGERSTELYDAFARIDLQVLQLLPTETLARILHPTLLAMLFQSVPVTAYDTLFHAACRHAARYPEDAMSIHSTVRQAIHAHPLRSSLLLSYGRRALNDGFISEAMDVIEQVESILPDSALVQYRKAMILDRAGKTSEAIEALHRGILLTANVSNYLQEARNAAYDASAVLREAIAQQQLVITPTQIQPKLDLIETYLFVQKTTEATALAQSIYDSTDMARAETVISIFEQNHALEALPTEYLTNQSSVAYDATARMEYAQKHWSAATMAWHESAMRALWPTQVYRKALEAIYVSGDIEALEQLAQLVKQNILHAPDGYHWQSIVLFHKNEPNAAISLLAEALEHSSQKEATYAHILLHIPESSVSTVLTHANQTGISPLAIIEAIADQAEAYCTSASKDKAEHVLKLLEILEPTRFVPYKNARILSRCAEVAGQPALAESYRLSADFSDLSKVL